MIIIYLTSFSDMSHIANNRSTHSRKKDANLQKRKKIVLSSIKFLSTVSTTETCKSKLIVFSFFFHFDVTNNSTLPFGNVPLQNNFTILSDWLSFKLVYSSNKNILNIYFFFCSSVQLKIVMIWDFLLRKFETFMIKFGTLLSGLPNGQYARFLYAWLLVQDLRRVIEQNSSDSTITKAVDPVQERSQLNIKKP